MAGGTVCTKAPRLWRPSTPTSSSGKPSGETRFAETRETGPTRASAMEAATASYDASTGGMISPRAPITRDFALGDRSLRISTHDAWVDELLSSSYAPLACVASDPGRTLEISPQRGFSAAFYALRDAFAGFAATTPGCAALYGACVALGDEAALILGPATIGKTLLALNSRSLGARFLGDELALLNLRDGTIRAVARAPALREPGLPHLLDAPLRDRISACSRAYSTERGRFWYALDAQTLGFACDARRHRLRAVCIVDDRSPRAAIEPVSSHAALGAVAKRMHGCDRSLPQAGALHRIMREVRCFQLTIGEPAETAACVVEGALKCA
jgi:hypothetical protein